MLIVILQQLRGVRKAPPAKQSSFKCSLRMMKSLRSSPSRPCPRSSTNKGLNGGASISCKPPTLIQALSQQDGKLAVMKNPKPQSVLLSLEYSGICSGMPIPHRKTMIKIKIKTSAKAHEIFFHHFGPSSSLGSAGSSPILIQYSVKSNWWDTDSKSAHELCLQKLYSELD